LDRLSSPRFHPQNGQSVIYSRRQYHMPDLNGSTTTLHFIDLKTNTTIQLTKPIWGIHDQQVINYSTYSIRNLLFFFFSFIGLIIKQFSFFLIVHLQV